MSDIVILTVLKFLGLGIGLATTIWGMTRQITFEGQEGRKRLTPAGYYAVALAMGSFLVAGVSQGFETLAKQAQQRDADLANAARGVRDMARESRESRIEHRQREHLSLTRLARAELLASNAEARAAQAEQRVLTLRTIDEERTRHVYLLREVVSGSQRNLSRASTILSQIDQLRYPVGQIELKVTFELENVSHWFPELAKYIAGWKKSELRRKGVIYDHWDKNDLKYVQFNSEFELYPRGSNAPDVAAIISGLSLHIGMYLIETNRKQTVSSSPDISFTMKGSSTPTLTYFISEDTLQFDVESDRDVPSRRSGRITSLDQVDRSLLTISRLSSVLIIPPSGLGDVNNAILPVSMLMYISGIAYESHREGLHQWSKGREVYRVFMVRRQQRPFLQTCPPSCGANR